MGGTEEKRGKGGEAEGGGVAFCGAPDQRWELANYRTGGTRRGG